MGLMASSTMTQVRAITIVLLFAHWRTKVPAVIRQLGLVTGSGMRRRRQRMPSASGRGWM